MNKDIIKWGDLLAEEIIPKHKKAIQTRPRPNYFLWPIKYVPSDTWVTKEWWIKTAIKLVEEEIDVYTGLEILLNVGKKAYLKTAINLIESVWNANHQCLYDAYYYYDIIVHFPKEHEIRKDFIDYKDMQSIDQDNPLRRALIRENDKTTCQYISNVIKQKIQNHSKDLEDYIMPIMAQFGKRCQYYISPNHIEYLKWKCRQFLKKDKWVIENDKENELLQNGKCSLWIRDSIAYWAWALGWDDIIQELRNSPWYWNNIQEIFCYDSDYDNFLVWSHYSDDKVLQEKAIEMMENYSLDEAIAWTRMRKLSA
jgi:hypothetical protein